MQSWIVFLLTLSLFELAAARSRHHRREERDDAESHARREPSSADVATESRFPFELELQHGITLRWTYTDEALEFALDLRASELQRASRRATSAPLVGFGIADRGRLESVDALVLRLDAFASQEVDEDASGLTREGAFLVSCFILSLSSPSLVQVECCLYFGFNTSIWNKFSAL